MRRPTRVASQVLLQETAMAGRVQRLEEITGVGRITAVTVLATIPELGQLNRRQAAALDWTLSV